MKLIKNVRVILIILLLLVSTYFLVSPFVFRKSGLVVSSISKDSKCSQMQEGDYVNQIGDTRIATAEDFKKAIATLKNGDYVAMVVNGGPSDCVAISDGNIGINVSELRSQHLNFGIDIQGGITTTVGVGDRSQEELNVVLHSIEKRIQILTLPQAHAYLSGSAIKIDSLTDYGIKTVISPGVFKTKIIQGIDLENSTGSIKIGSNLYDVISSNTTLSVNGSSYSYGQSFVLDGIVFDVTNTSAVAEANVLSNEDVIKSSTGYVSYNSDAKKYEFYIPMEISKTASEKILKVARGLKYLPTGSQIMLQGQIVYYLDDEAISILNIPYDMSTKEISAISVIGLGSDMNQMVAMKSKVFAMLQSGKLPENLEVINMQPYAPQSRQLAIYVSASFAIALILVATSLFYFRYKKLKLPAYAILLVSIEIAILVGIAALTQAMYQPGWIIDFQTIVGMIGAAFIGTIQLFLVAEKDLKNKIIGLKYRYKPLIGLPMLLSILVAIVAFLTLFTPWRGLGLSLLIGLMIEVSLTRDVYKEIIKSS